jgi:hypothetical protein
MRKELTGIIEALSIDNRFGVSLRQLVLSSCDTQPKARALLNELEHDEKEGEYQTNSGLYALFKSCAYDELKEKISSINSAKDAVSKFGNRGDDFNEALAQWFTGILYKEYGEEHLAVPEFEDAIKRLARCSECYASESKYKNKKDCELYIDKITRSLRVLETRTTSKSVPTSTSSGVSSRWNKARLIFRVYDVGHASKVGKFTLDDPIDSKVEIDQVVIEDRPYYLYNCRGGTEIQLTSNGDYRWVKVVGESMNKAVPMPIEPDDYVLVDVNLPPDKGLIVFASLRNPPTSAERAGIIKRYSSKGFISESTLTIEPIPLKEADVRGVIIAVAKEGPS